MAYQQPFPCPSCGNNEWDKDVIWHGGWIWEEVESCLNCGFVDWPWWQDPFASKSSLNHDHDDDFDWESRREEDEWLDDEARHSGDLPYDDE